MNLIELQDRVIDIGIGGAKRDYASSPDKLRGAIQGFEACRGKTPSELKELLEVAGISQQDAFRRQSDDYWYYRIYQAEVEWVCNCISAALMNEGLPVIIVPTLRGAMNVASILSGRPNSTQK